MLIKYVLVLDAFSIILWYFHHCYNQNPAISINPNFKFFMDVKVIHDQENIECYLIHLFIK